MRTVGASFEAASQAMIVYMYEVRVMSQFMLRLLHRRGNPYPDHMWSVREWRREKSAHRPQVLGSPRFP